METTTIVYMVLAVLVGGAAAWLLLQRGQEMTPDTLLNSVKEAATVAQTLVQAAEQLSETGQIAKDARFNYVFGRLRELFPNLSEDTLIAALEAGVYLVTKAQVLLDPPDGE